MSTNPRQATDDISRPPTSQDPLWWDRRTRLEKTLCLVAVVCLLLFALTAVVFAVCGYFYVKHSERVISFNTASANVCLTPGCVKAASEILLSIDESVDPCSDFYQFSCGGWLNQHTIAQDDLEFNSLVELTDDFTRKLTGLFEEEVKNSELPYIKMIKNLYNSCVDLDAIEEAGVDPLKKVLSTFGGWPVVEGKKWNPSKFNWLESLISLRKLGFNHNVLFSIIVDVDEMNNTLNIIQLSKPKLGMSHRIFLVEEGLNDTLIAAYFKQMVESAKHLGANDTTVEKELLKALHFEMILANYSTISDKDKENDSKGDNKYTVKELQNMTPQIPWLKLLNNLVSNEIHENETLVVEVPEYIRNFATQVTRTQKRVIANYMMWRVVDASLFQLSKEWRDIKFEFFKSISGLNQETPRQEHCIDMVKMHLNIILSSYYMRQHFDEGSENLVSEIAKYIHEEFLDILDEIEWMDKVTKAHAREKAKNMKFVIGYPKELLNDTILTQFYKKPTITNDGSYYENMFKINKWSIDNEFSNLRKRNVRGEWMNYAAAEINGFYDASENVIQFPPGILQKSFFNKDRPQYMNFGAIGSIIGHEITHGFDDIGRLYDKDGNKLDWWEPISDQEFKQKAQCIIDQYSNYTTVIGMNVDGEKTQAENIADNGGLKEAYLAYLSWVENNGLEQLLPGLKYSQRQLFWISHAYIHCGKTRPEAIRLQLFYEEHSPSNFRVIGPMSNLEEFSRDFNCPLNSPMNKQGKCQVW